MAETDWQAKKSLAETNLYMLEQEVACDVIFLVGERKDAVKAHKFMLVSRSCVFYAMLQGALKESKDVIAIPDIDKDIFICLMRFLYSEEAAITAGNVMGLVYAGKKYGVLTLVDMCGEFLTDNITIDNVCTIFNQADFFDEDALKETCLSFILVNGEDVLRSPGFRTLTPDCLKSVLVSDQLDAEEELVYTASMEWSVEECHRGKLEVSNENQRAALGDILYLIRFPIMNQEFFAGTVSVNTILEDHEKVSARNSILNRYNGVGNLFCARNRCPPRRISQRVKIERFRNLNIGWAFPGSPDAVSFTCSRNIFLLGVSIFTPSFGQYSGHIKLVDENGACLTKKTINVSNNNSLHTAIMFAKPAKIEREKKYHILQTGAGKDGRFGESGQATVSTKNLTVTFTNSYFSANGTQATRGQIPCLLFGW